MGTLSGKIAWITGGGSGIGEAGARALAAAGALVIISSRHQMELDRIAESIRSSGGKAEGVACEVSDAQAVQQAADGILRHYGRVDILVASAGTNIGKRFWKDVTPVGWDQVVSVDLDGDFLREGARLLAQLIMEGEVTEQIGAGKYQRTPECQDQVEMSANHQVGMSPDYHRKCPLSPQRKSCEIRQGWPPPPRSRYPKGAWVDQEVQPGAFLSGGNSRL